MKSHVSKDQAVRTRADHELHVKHWGNEKKQSGKWLSKQDYEKKTGKPGQS